MKTSRSRSRFSSIELLEARIAPAAFIVTNNRDDHNGGTLREAVEAANARPGLDTISFLPAAYGEILLETARQAINITDAVTIRGPGSAKLQINGSDGIRIFFITDGDDNTNRPVSLSGLSLVNGGLGTNGGAIYSNEPLTLRDVVVASSSSNNLGGGLYVETTGKVNIVSSSFLGNVGPTGGGGLYVSAAAGVVISNTTIADNVTGGSIAGGGAWLGGATISLDHVSVLHNSAPNGGGLTVSATGAITLKNSLIMGNHADAMGGGIEKFSGLLNVTNTTISFNSADESGGGYHVLTGGKSTFTRVTFLGNSAAGNTASTGGGALFTQNGDVTISASKFLGNQSAREGGAIYNGLGFAVIQGSNSLFQGNTAARNGGAIAFERDGSTGFLTGDTFSGNHAAIDGGAIYASNVSVITIKGGSFLGNSAEGTGGAIRGDTLNADVPVFTVSGALFQRNHATLLGGAILLADPGASTIVNSKFFDNFGGLGGGALYVNGVVGGGSLGITGSVFLRNQANNGGAIYAASGAAVSLTNCSVLGNLADFRMGQGGGLYVDTASVTLLRTRIMGNFAQSGAGVFNSNGNVTFNPVDTKITGNYASVDPNTSGF